MTGQTMQDRVAMSSRGDVQGGRGAAGGGYQTSPRKTVTAAMNAPSMACMNGMATSGVG